MEKVIINVGRQVGSGGSEIAQLLAKEFNARLLDKELLDLAAKESGFSAKLFKQHDEHRGFLNHLFHVRGTVTSGPFYEDKLSPEALFKFQSDAIRKAASEGSCVFIVIERKEEERAAYYNYYTGKRWGDSKSYDLCVNSSLLGKEGTARLISGFVREVISKKKDNCD